MAAIELARRGDVPVPVVEWRKENVVALRRLPGVELGRLGVPSTASPAAWAAAGALAAKVHALPLPPWRGWSIADFTGRVEEDCRWLVDERVAPADRRMIEHDFEASGDVAMLHRMASEG